MQQENVQLKKFKLDMLKMNNPLNSMEKTMNEEDKYVLNSKIEPQLKKV